MRTVGVVFRLLGGLLTVAFAVVTVVLTWPGLFRVERMAPIAQLIAFRGLLVAAFAVIAILFLILTLVPGIRALALSVAILAAVGAIGGGLQLAGRGVGTSALPESTPTSIRVMTWNTAGNAMGAAEIAQTAFGMDASIITLPETAAGVGEDVALAMRDMGRPMWVHHVAYNDEVERGPQAWQTTLLISPELGDYSVISASADGDSNTEVVPSVIAMPVSGDGPIVVAAHAVSPRLSYLDKWDQDLRWIADQCVDGNVILAGDFNATIDHLRGLGVGEADMGYCIDAAAATGNGAVGTWPTSLPALLAAPIDHVMVSSAWKPTGSVVLTGLDGTGSDHRPVIVQLEPVH